MVCVGEVDCRDTETLLTRFDWGARDGRLAGLNVKYESEC